MLTKGITNPPYFFEPTPEHILLISYPRSGNTWVRFLLANLITFPTGVPVNFQDIHTHIPDVMLAEDSLHLNTQPCPKIVKSHALYHSSFNKAIYILRDGRDVMLSYYHYLRNRGHYRGSLLAFLCSRRIWPASWASHVQAWLSQQTDNILVVRYEDLQANPVDELARMAAFIELPATNESITWAVEQASFKRMKRLAITHGVGTQAKRTPNFIRKGQVGNWQTEFSLIHKLAFKATANSTLRRYGYINDDGKW